VLADTTGNLTGPRPQGVELLLELNTVLGTSIVLVTHDPIRAAHGHARAQGWLLQLRVTRGGFGACRRSS
jgi:predicted ABC-type transport system involved in lysophospholipase L1 biosynthesis ATPase subunit